MYTITTWIDGQRFERYFETKEEAEIKRISLIEELKLTVHKGIWKNDSGTELIISYTLKATHYLAETHY